MSESVTGKGEMAAEAEPLLTRRQRHLLRRAGSVLLLVLLLAFCWAFVYTFLLAGWWLLNGYAFSVEENGFAWWGLADWILMALALAAVWPAQRWLRPQIAHIVHGTDENAYALMSRLSQQAGGALPEGSLLGSMVHLLAEALGVAYVGLETEDEGLAAAYGAPPAGTTAITFPLHYATQALGTLHIAPRLVAGTPVYVDGQLLHNLARQVSLTLYAARLSADVQASRRRIVTAREEGRRQLRRDLHDGLGPSLATLTMQADTARELVYDDPAGAERLLGELVDQAQATVAEVRRIVHGLRPPALDELGLYGALELLATSLSSPGLEITVELPAARPTLSAAQEVAIYRIVQEALTNVSRHAAARQATVSLTDEQSGLALAICDDGSGPPQDAGGGMGLHNMRERAEELGGTLVIRPNEPAGTCLLATFPLDSGEKRDGTDPRPDL
jgi:signal transduction histidine kinase